MCIQCKLMCIPVSYFRQNKCIIVVRRMFFYFCMCIGEVTSQSHDHDLSQSRAKELEQQVQALTGELDTCRQEMDEFDLVKSDWTMEKEALEEVLLTLREQLTRKASEEDVQKEGVMKDDDVLEVGCRLCASLSVRSIET